ncbi:RNA polymerase sigma-70 factor, ECF subfamily [Nonomuraea solani]|uniref:RNA polymerase sigma-70 factor, ECF subfamily n=1 Tax=Nonomuraea solani TaxID=1144553 RepID=A0A1H6E2T1_9ACTN|nr:RNA polymerase sigma factor [Nonomuraea solani]SEG91932.1 RNA polymerase sigma-70 factor, ECF subfamily [Nonomuraea solani]
MRMAAPPDMPALLDDTELIARSWQHPDSFAVLYDRYFVDIYRYVAGRIGTQFADDVAAETFLVAFRKRETFDPDRGTVRAWLFGIVTNLIGHHRRSETRRLELLQRASATQGTSDPGHEDRVAAWVSAAGLRGRLAAELERLSDGDRDVLLLVALAGLSHEEIAQTLDIPFGTVGSRLNRVRRKLRAALGGVNPTIGEADA